jgi:hypothetical protein
MKAGTGSCAHCGTAIANVFVIECGNSERFGVGCDCILKLDRSPKLVDDVRKAKRRADKESRYRREAAKLSEAAQWIEKHREDLAQVPHPQAWRADKGETLADSISWMWSNAGTSGKLRAYRQAVKMLTA